MRKSLVLGLSLLTMGVVVAACTGSSGDDSSTSPTPTASPSPSPSPSPAGSTTATFLNWPHAGAINYVRVINGTNAAASAIYCKPMVTIANSGTGVVVVNTTLSLTLNSEYQFEVFADLNGDGNFDPGAGNTNDHDYRSRGIKNTSGSLSFVIDHNQTAGPNSFTDTTWATNTACPGD